MTPLTALKFAELTVKAGIPKGVINIVPGSGNSMNEMCWKGLKLSMLCGSIHEMDIPCFFLSYPCLSPLSLPGGLVGQRLSDHPDIRKLGFTGSTPIGKQIMKRYSAEVGQVGWGCTCVCLVNVTCPSV